MILAVAMVDSWFCCVYPPFYSEIIPFYLYASIVHQTPKLACAKQSEATFIGLEIDEERAQEAIANIEQEGMSHKIQIIQGNALECDFSNATGKSERKVPFQPAIFILSSDMLI